MKIDADKVSEVVPKLSGKTVKNLVKYLSKFPLQEWNVLKNFINENYSTDNLLDKIIRNAEGTAYMMHNIQSRLRPVIFTAFANPTRDLENLNQELKGIQDELISHEFSIHLEQYIDTNTKDCFKYIKNFEGRIRIFHFGGHANSEVLSLQNSDVFFEPLAKELVLRNPTSLRLVFLNGCATEAHAEILMNLGVPAVIATSTKIDDKMATEFAVEFYKRLASEETIETAFNSTCNSVQSNSNVKYASNTPNLVETKDKVKYEKKITRFTEITGSENDTDKFAWGLYVKEGVNLTNEKLF